MWEFCEQNFVRSCNFWLSSPILSSKYQDKASNLSCIWDEMYTFEPPDTMKWINRQAIKS